MSGEVHVSGGPGLVDPKYIDRLTAFVQDSLV